MIYFIVVILVANAYVSSSIDVEKLQSFPEPLKTLDLKRFSGYWYMQGRTVPCTWSGSKTFTDYVYNVQPRGNSYITTCYWRNNGLCANIDTVTNKKSPGILQIKDPIGNVFSGEWYILETDYKNYCISYGCTKPSVTGDKCAEPWITAETRHLKPDYYTLVKIDRILKSRFGFSLSYLIKVWHKNPCVDVPTKSKPTYVHLSKKY